MAIKIKGIATSIRHAGMAWQRHGSSRQAAGSKGERQERRERDGGVQAAAAKKTRKANGSRVRAQNGKAGNGKASNNDKIIMTIMNDPIDDIQPVGRSPRALLLNHDQKCMIYAVKNER